MCCDPYTQAVDKALSAAVQLSTSQASPLLSAPWGLHFISHASSSALLVTSRALLQSVRFWKAGYVMAGAAGTAGAAAGGLGRSGSGSSGGRLRPALMARALNHQHSLGGDKQQQQGSSSGKGAGASSEGAGRSATLPAILRACAKSASILSQWLKGPAGDSLAAAATGATFGAAAALQEEHVETIECLGTSLLLMLQALPAQHLTASSRGAAAAAATGRVASPTTSGRAAAALPSAEATAAMPSSPPAELLELEAALLELLPALCKACATAVSQQQDAAAAAAAAHQPLPVAAGNAVELQARQAYVAVMLQLLIEILKHQLSPALWLGPVSRHLDLVPMLTAVATRANGLGPLPPAPPAGWTAAESAAVSAAAGISSSDAAATAGAAVGVTDISVLELLQAVAEVPEGALQLWQQGVLPVLIGFCRQLLHGPDQMGLLGAAALGYVSPDASILAALNAGPANLAAGGAGGGAELSAQSALAISTVGAYMAAGGSSSSSTGSRSSSSDAAVAAVWSPRHQQWCLLLALWVSVLQQLSKTVRVSDIATEFVTAAEPRLQLAVQLLSSNYHQSRTFNSNSSAQGGLDADLDTPANRALVLAMTGFTPDGLKPGGGRGASSAVLLTLGNLLEAERALLLLKFMVNDIGDWELQRPGALASFRSAAASLIEFVAAPMMDR